MIKDFALFTMEVIVYGLGWVHMRIEQVWNWWNSTPAIGEIDDSVEFLRNV